MGRQSLVLLLFECLGDAGGDLLLGGGMLTDDRLCPSTSSGAIGNWRSSVPSLFAFAVNA